MKENEGEDIQIHREQGHLISLLTKNKRGHRQQSDQISFLIKISGAKQRDTDG
jgi:hypothetical protein